jgi:hypothetical protein
LKNKIDQLKGVRIYFYNAEIYKNSKEETVLIVFDTTRMYLVDVGRKEIKIVLKYKEIKDVKLEEEDKVRIFFSKEIQGV